MAFTFDADYYKAQRGDVYLAYLTVAGTPGAGSWPEFAEAHYNNHGWRELANPHPNFNTEEYLDMYPDIRDAGINPFQHFLNHGVHEGRAPSASFPKLGVEFNAETYLNANPDLVAAGITTPEQAYAHFVLHGQFEGRAGAPAVDSGIPGQTYTFSKEIQNLEGTSADDVFNAVINNDGTTDNSTYQSGDSARGGLGNDILNITVTKFAGDPIVDLDGIESINIRNLDTGTAAKLKAGTWSGVKQVSTTASTADVEVSGLKNLVMAGVDSTASGLTLVFDDAVVAGTSDTLEISATNAGTATTAAAITTKNASGSTAVIEAASITSNGTSNNLNIDGLGNAVKSITVRGEAAATIEANKTAVTTIDLSAATGGVTVVDTGGAFAGTAAAGLSVKGGAGKDTIAVALTNKAIVDMGAGDDVVTLSDVANLTKDDSIKGGDGVDTLVLASADAKTVAANSARTAISGFEILRLSGDFEGGAAKDDFDISKLGFNTVQLTGDVKTADATISGFTSGATVELRNAGNQTKVLNIGIEGATGAGTDNDTLNLKLNADLVSGATHEVKVGVNGINIINVAAYDLDNSDKGTDASDGYKLTLSNDANVATINISGDRAVTYDATATATAVKLVDATDSTGDVTIDLTNFAGTQGVEVRGGAGKNDITGTKLADIITGGAKNDVLEGGEGDDKISGGAGDDEITGGKGADTLTGGEGKDTFVIAAGDSIATAFDTITDLAFGVGGDIIKFGNTAASAANIKSLSAAAQEAVSAKATLADALTQVAVETSGAKIVTVFNWNNDTYLMYNNADDDTFDAGADSVIKITGVTGEIDVSNIYVA